MRPTVARRALAPAIAVLLACSLLASCSRAEAGGAGPMSAGRWQVDFRDEFTGQTLDAQRWTTCYWWDDGGCTNLGNDEAEWYVPSAVGVGDGHLRLTASEARSEHLGRSFAYESGMVTTGRIGSDPDDVARYAFTYGYVEVRFRTPDGAGLWPAIWMLPVTNRSLPEIDLLEQYGDDTATSSMTFHPAPGTGSEGRRRRYVRGTDLAGGWHTVGLQWSKGRLQWFLDGRQRFEVTGDDVPDEPMYLLVNLAVGGNAGHPPAATTFPASFLVDEITVWKQT
ncbi:MAG: glycoside hydrolase family 16 protein [Aquihabitans sp.]